MNWFLCSIVTFFLWGTYTIFANKANAIHGEKVTLVFEMVGFVLLTFLVAGTARKDFLLITTKSACYAAVMAAMSVIGFYLLLLSLRKAPDRLTVITLITSAYAVWTVIVVTAVLKFKPEWLPEAKMMTPTQCVGAALVLVGLVLVNWDPLWTEKIRKFL